MYSYTITNNCYFLMIKFPNRKIHISKVPVIHNFPIVYPLHQNLSVRIVIISMPLYISSNYWTSLAENGPQKKNRRPQKLKKNDIVTITWQNHILHSELMLNYNNYEPSYHYGICNVQTPLNPTVPEVLFLFTDTVFLWYTLIKSGNYPDKDIE